LVFPSRFTRLNDPMLMRNKSETLSGLDGNAFLSKLLVKKP